MLGTRLGEAGTVREQERMVALEEGGDGEQEMRSTGEVTREPELMMVEVALVGQRLERMTKGLPTRIAARLLERIRSSTDTRELEEVVVVRKALEGLRFKVVGTDVALDNVLTQRIFGNVVTLTRVQEPVDTEVATSGEEAKFEE